jgi:phosphoribosylformylglycinamidine synthase subunit PurL
MKVYLDKAPTRQQNMKGWEILLSESQERMLVVVEAGKEEIVEKVFEKWDLNCTKIGEVIEGERLEFYMHGEKIADVPAESLVLGGGAPIYEREFKEPAYYAQNKKFNIDSIKLPSDYKAVMQHLAKHPNIASKRWITNQYDSMVGTINMNSNAPADAAVVDVRGTKKALALTTDCNPRYVHADPEVGCAIAVSEAARNIVCAGGDPSAVTNCLNFGNPYNPEVYWQFVGAIKGMSTACLKFETPVTGGNVSFYNQSKNEQGEVPVFPTPTIGMVGIIQNKNNRMTLDFKSEGDAIYLLGSSKDDVNSSEYLYSFCGVKGSPAPYFNLDEEFDVQQLVAKLIKAGLVNSAHDVSDGGLFITLLESSMPRGLGFSVECDEDIRKDAFLFGEAQGRIVVSVSQDKLDEFVEMIAETEVDFYNLGEVKGDEIMIDGESFGKVAEYSNSYNNSLSDLLN